MHACNKTVLLSTTSGVLVQWCDGLLVGLRGGMVVRTTLFLSAVYKPVA